MTHVLDKGTPATLLADVLTACGSSIDLWKFGWGTAYIDPQLELKLELLARHGVRACVGGTLLEVAWVQHRVDEFHSWAADAGFHCIEVSRGVAAMSPGQKFGLIRRFAPEFTVLSEVGFKNPLAPLPCDEWAREVALDLEAGARWVVAEGRESGTVGIYDDAGTVREEIVSCIVGVGGLQNLIFEAPRKDQQAWFIQKYGADVNLGNIAAAEVMSLETLRLGLRADTIALASPVVARSAC